MKTSSLSLALVLLLAAGAAAGPKPVRKPPDSKRQAVSRGDLARILNGLEHDDSKFATKEELEATRRSLPQPAPTRNRVRDLERKSDELEQRTR